jgi:hypothetical protein
MTEQDSTYQGFSNYETYTCHVWLTHQDDGRAYLAELVAEDISMEEKVELLSAYIWDELDIQNDLAANLLLPVLDRINCQEIIEHAWGEREMKHLIIGTLIGIAVVILAFVALAPPNIEVYEDGSYTSSGDIPFSPAWSDWGEERDADPTTLDLTRPGLPAGSLLR